MNFRNMKILTIDNNKSHSLLMNKLLWKYCDYIISVDNDLAALDIIKEEDIDLIITALDIPIISGINLIKNIRNYDFKIPIAVVSSTLTSDFILASANSNIQAYIEKPLNDEKIIKLINNIMKYYLHIIKPQKDTSSDKIFITNNVYYNKKNFTILNKNSVFILTNKEKLLLELLLENKNKLVSYKHIDFIVWQKEGTVMTNDALKNVVKNLRIKITKESIKNLSGLGYKLLVKNV